MRIQDKVVIITGASGGIGRSLAMELGKKGAIVVLASRSMDKLRELALILNGYDIKNHCVLLDVTSPESIKSLVRETIEKYGKIDVLINNASVGLFEDVIHSTEEDTRTIFDTNFFGPLRLIKEVVYYMGDGLVVNMSSSASKYAPYRYGMYSATKSALERITEALDTEQENVRTLLVLPSRAKTPFMENLIGSRENATLSLNLKSTDPEVVAKKIVVAILKDKSMCYTTLNSRVYSLLSTIYPSLIRRMIIKTAKYGKK